MLCSETANGSARMACSSSIPSGTACSIDGWAGISSAYPPVASLDTPVWMPGLMVPEVKLQHRLLSPASHAGQIGVMPLGTHDSHGSSTTRWPTSTPVASGPSSTTSATTSCPITCGNEHSPLIALSLSPSKSSRICFESDPQTPVRSGLVTTQSGRNGRASSMSRRATGVTARLLVRRLAPGGGVHGSGSVPNTSALMVCLRRAASRPGGRGPRA